MTFVSFALELGRLMMPQLAVLIVLWVLCDFAVGKLNAPRPLVLAVLWLFLLIETLNVGSRVTLFFQSREFQIPKVSWYPACAAGSPGGLAGCEVFRGEEVRQLRCCE